MLLSKWIIFPVDVSEWVFQHLIMLSLGMRSPMAQFWCALRIQHLLITKSLFINQDYKTDWINCYLPLSNCSVNKQWFHLVILTCKVTHLHLFISSINNLGKNDFYPIICITFIGSHFVQSKKSFDWLL